MQKRQCDKCTRAQEQSLRHDFLLLLAALPTVHKNLLLRTANIGMCEHALQAGYDAVERAGPASAATADEADRDDDQGDDEDEEEGTPSMNALRGQQPGSAANSAQQAR